MKNQVLLLLFALTVVTGFGQTTHYPNVLKTFIPPQLGQSKVATRNAFDYGSNTRNSLSRPGLESMYAWNVSAWEHMVDVHYTYDGTGNEIESIITDAGTNKNLLRKFSSYNSDNQLAGELEQDWIGNTWVDAYKTKVAYDSFGNYVSKVGELWTGAKWDTVNGERHTYKYNNAGYVLEDVYMDWDSVWFPVRKVVSTPGANGEWIDFTDYIWENGNWSPNQHIENIVWHNFSEREPEMYTMQLFDSTGWRDSEKYTTVYSVNNSFVATTQIKNSSGNWENQSRLEISYDALNNFLGFIYDIWMFNHWSFMAEQRFMLTYDPYQNLVESVRQWRDMNAPGLYINELRKVYGEYPATTAISDELQNIKLNAWPNPVINSLFVNVSDGFSEPAEIELTDMTGKVYYSDAVSLNENCPLEIQMQSYPPGIFILQLKTKEGLIKRKIEKF